MKKTIIIIVVAIVLIQLIPVDRDNPTVKPADEIVVTGEVNDIIKQACYNCHSNQTSWPWYSYVAPVSWLITHDVHEGRGELNFSNWNLYSEKRQKRKMNEIADQVEEADMPLPIYTIMHREADLSENQRKILISWANSYFDDMKQDSTSTK